MRRGNRNIAGAIIVGTIASAIGIAAGLLIHWFPTAASTQAAPIDTLWDVLLIVSIPIFVTVSCVVLFSVKWFRMRPGQEQDDGAPIHGNTRLEVVWTALPSILIASLVVYAYLVLSDIEKAPADPAREMHVNVHAQQFAWQFEYKGTNGKTVKSDDLYLPVGRSVKFDIRSDDVLHDFWVPAFRMKIDAVPGIKTHYRVTPNKLGNFEVVCAELCGLGHAFMRADVHVVSGNDFSAWLAKAGEPPAAAGGSQTAAVDGKKLFTEGNGTATACGSCHTLADAGTTAKIGPDLDKAIATLAPAAIRKDIVDPNAAIYPGFSKGIMPADFAKTLSPKELDALVNYLDKVTSK